MMREPWQYFHGSDRGRCLTPADWRLGRPASGYDPRYRWVNPNSGYNCTKEDWPYSYSEHYLWGEKTKDSEAVYSDRLAQWDHTKHRDAVEAVADLKCRYGHWGQAGTSKFLSSYYGKPVNAIAVAEGCNVSNGYPYFVFWFKAADSSSREKEAG